MKRREIENGANHQAILSVWNKGLADAARRPSAKQQLLRRENELLPQFAAQYQKLAALPRRARRGLQRQWKRSLAGIALMLALGAQPALAATINVGGQCTLIRAIVSANNDFSPGGLCRPGGGADRIVLPRNSTHTLTRINNANYGPTGLPTIRSNITIAGNGSTIRRAPRAPRFRIFFLLSDNLTLQQTTVSGGFASGPSPSAQGGGVFSMGSLTLLNSTISGNSGGGVQSLGGNVILTSSTVSRNNGGAIFADSANVRLMNSTVSNNPGGGVFVAFDDISVANSTISNNSGTALSAVVGSVTVINSTISGNSAGVGGSEGRVYLVNTTITGNRGIGVGGDVNAFISLSRTIVSGNTIGGGQEVVVDDTSSVGANNFNIFGHSGNARVAGFTPGGTDIVPTQPLAGVLNPRLANNGGRTLTHALVNGSPAIDAVNDGTCPPPATDQRGLSRPRDGNRDGGVACDIGAVEALGPPGMPGAAPAPVPQQPAPVDPGPVDPGPIDPDPMNPAPMNPDSSVPPEESSDDMGMPPPAS